MTWKTRRANIDDALTARKSWETRQGDFYVMRHDGFPRASMPWKNASDLHFPLVDSFIDKLKPFYVQQIYGSETVAKFISCDPQTDGKAESAERWFDYTLKQNSNFESETQVAVDWMLQGGFSNIKIYWDHARKRLSFDAIEPEYLIVPQWTRGLQEADWVVQVHRFSEDAFEREPMFRDVSKEDRKKVMGRGTMDADVREQYKARREGITYSTKDEIIVWEVWRRDDAEKNDWVVEWRSPVNDEVVLRPAMRNPYRHKQLPFVEFQYEVKDKGYYASRGIAERLAPLETSITRIWNEFHDAMVLVNRPLFKAPKGTTVQGTSLSWSPGDIITADIERLNTGTVSVDFEREMNNIRTIAEYLISMPDFGIVDENGGARTATEIRARAGQSGQTNDLRARVFRKSLARVYNQAWALCAEFMTPGKYVMDGATADMDTGGMSDDYIIHPSGSADAWNKDAEQQKGTGLFQMLNQDPMTDQIELRKFMLNKLDPVLARTLIKDPGVNLADQSAKQATELTDMIVTAFPVQVNQTDDDAIHMQAIGQWVMAQVQKGAPISPETAVLVLQHGMSHEQAGMKKKNPQMQQVTQSVTPAVQVLTQIAQAAQAKAQMAQHAAPNGAAPMPNGPRGMPSPAPAGPPMPPGGNGSAPATQGPPQGDSDAINGLGAAMKAGLPVTIADWSAALQRAGLPPFSPGSPTIVDPGSAMKPQGVPIPQRPPPPMGVPA